MGVKIKPAATQATEAVQEAVADAAAKNMSSVQAELLEVMPLKALTDQIKALKGQVAALEDQKKILEARAVAIVKNHEVPDFEGVTVTDGKASLTVGPCAQTTEVTDKEGLFNALESVKAGLVFELANVTLGDARKYLSDDQMSKFTQIVPGNRKVTVK